MRSLLGRLVRQFRPSVKLPKLPVLIGDGGVLRPDHRVVRHSCGGRAVRGLRGVQPIPGPNLSVYRLDSNVRFHLPDVAVAHRSRED